MASLEQRQKFIAEITPLVQKYADKYGYSQNVVPAIVAQACCESGYGNQVNALPRIANNYFGIRHGSKLNFMGLAYDSRTGKVVPSEQINITVSNRGYYWRAYNSMEESVEGYFKFLSEHKAYAKLKNIDDPNEYLMAVGRAGYAGSGEKYSKTCIGVITTNNLIDYCNQNQYDPTSVSSSSEASTEETSTGTTKTEETTSSTESTEKSSSSTDTIISSDKEAIESSIMTVKANNNYSTTYVINNNITTESTTTGIPNNLNLAQNSYLEISDSLTGLISKELSAIESIAKTYDDMDKTLANEQINSFLSPEVNIDVNFTSYLFEPSSLIQGSTGRINKTDIAGLTNGTSLTGPLHENFEHSKESAKATIESINDLQATIKKYSGTVWDQVVKKLDEYNEVLELKIKSADKLESAMAKALEIVLAYLEDYDSIDDSKLQETVESILEAKKIIATLKLSINQTQTASKEVTDDDGKTKTVQYTEYVYSTSAREAMQKKVAELELIVEDLTKEVKKQEGLYDVMARAEQIINDALSSIYSDYAAKVNNIVASNSVSYTPPANTTYISPSSIKTSLPLNSTSSIPSGKISKENFEKDNQLINTYGTYEDYLNGVEKVNNPKYTSTANSGIELSEELSNLLTKNPVTKEEPRRSRIVRFSSNQDTEKTILSSSIATDKSSTPSDTTDSSIDSSSSPSSSFYETEEISSSIDTPSTDTEEVVEEIDPKIDEPSIIKDSTTITTPSKSDSKSTESTKDSYYYDDGDDTKDIFSNNSNSIFKTVGIATATVGAVGATAYGAKKYLEKRKNENNNDDSPTSTIDNISERDNDDTGLDDFE